MFAIDVKQICTTRARYIPEQVVPLQTYYFILNSLDIRTKAVAMKLMKKAAVNSNPSQVRYQKIIINFWQKQNASQHVAQPRFGNKPGKVYTVFIRL